MPKKVEEKIHILCPSRAFLAPAKVMGPIVHPLQVTKSVAVQLLMSGAEVHEYNPYTKQTIRLTLANIKDDTRYNAIDTTAAVAPKEVAVEPIKKMGVPNVQPKEPDEVKVEEVEEEITTTEEQQMPAVEDITSEESTATTTVTSTSDPVADLVFVYNEDGTVDETNIDWSIYTKNQRKAIRAKINEHNNSLNA